MKWLAIALGVIAAVIALYLVIDYLVVTDEEVIEDLFDKAVEAIEKEDITSLLGFVAEDFKYEAKGVNKRRLEMLALQTFREVDNVSFETSEKSIEVQGDEATIRISFRILGEYVGRMEQFVGERGFILGKPLKAARATLHLRRQPPVGNEKPTWLLYRLTEFDPGFAMPTGRGSK